MTTRVAVAGPDEQASGLVVLTVYARADLAVCSRVLQAFTIRPFTVERVVADLSRFDHREVRGLEDVDGPVMRIALVVSLQRDNDLERVGKLLNRVVDVYKVEQTFRV